MRNVMPRPRKYDYQKDYPVRTALYVKIPTEIYKELEKMDLIGQNLSKLVERKIVEYVENNRKKD
jgi:hypothetical protein